MYSRTPQAFPNVPVGKTARRRAGLESWEQITIIEIAGLRYLGDLESSPRLRELSREYIGVSPEQLQRHRLQSNASRCNIIT